jgi:multicomponent Na+:H+ antiporter subunit E
MTIHDVASIGRQQTPPAATDYNNEVLDGALSSWRLRGALTTGMVIVALWGGLHWDDPASWTIGVPTALISGALVLFLPPSATLRLSSLGVLRFAKFAIIGILRGAVDVSRRSLSPRTLQPGLIPWRTYLPKGRPRQLFAVAITLLPGTLTARIVDDILTIHTLDPSDATRDEIAALEAHIAKLYRLDRKEVLS